jgi:hypothetical protein
MSSVREVTTACAAALKVALLARAGLQRQGSHDAGWGRCEGNLEVRSLLLDGLVGEARARRRLGRGPPAPHQPPGQREAVARHESLLLAPVLALALDGARAAAVRPFLRLGLRERRLVRVSAFASRFQLSFNFNLKFQERNVGLVAVGRAVGRAVGCAVGARKSRRAVGPPLAPSRACAALFAG